MEEAEMLVEGVEERMRLGEALVEAQCVAPRGGEDEVVMEGVVESLGQREMVVESVGSGGEGVAVGERERVRVGEGVEEGQGEGVEAA